MGAADRWAQPPGEVADDESGIRLAPVSYIVLGFLAFAGAATPYDLKRLTSSTVSNLWSVNHSQLYKEPERLASAGYLQETREPGGAIASTTASPNAAARRSRHGSPSQARNSPNFETRDS